MLTEFGGRAVVGFILRRQFRLRFSVNLPCFYFDGSYLVPAAFGVRAFRFFVEHAFLCDRDDILQDIT